MQPKTRRLVTEASLETHTSSSLYPVQSELEALSNRTASLETMGGLTPGEVIDGQTANLIQQATSTTRASLNLAVSETIFDVPGPTGAESSDKARVVAACQQAVDEGRKVVTLGPGYYNLAGFTVDDILDRYLVGEGVSFSAQSNVYPFKPNETLGRTTDIAHAGGGRGAIAFEIDDSQDSHWWRLFPLSKELGVPMATAWHTDWAPWVKEAVRHGWEAMSHLPDNYRATDQTPAQLEAYAEETLDALEWATGTRDGHGFVYPQHYRNEDTDRILSKYFVRGRAGNHAVSYPMDAPNPWWYEAYDIDDDIAGGMNSRMKSILDSIAASNSKMILLSHWRLERSDQLEIGFRELIAYARNLGIDIRLPRQLMSRSQVVPDPYFQNNAWTTSNVQYDTTEKYHAERSARFEPAVYQHLRSPRFHLTTPPNQFTVVRPSIRVKSSGVKFSNATQGAFFQITTWQRQLNGGSDAGRLYTMRPFLLPGPSLPDQDWHRHRTTYFLPPNVLAAQATLASQNLTAGTMWVDEFQLDIIDYVSELVFEGVTHDINATVAAWVDLPAIGLEHYTAEVELIDEFNGEPELEVDQNRMTLYSSDSFDFGKRYRVRFLPTRDYQKMSWSQEGA